MLGINAAGAARRLLRSDFARHGALVFLATIGAQLCSYGYHAFTSRHLGVVRYGELFWFVNVLSFVQSTVGQPTSVVMARYTAEYTSGRNRDAVRILVFRGLAFGAILGIAVIALAVLAQSPLAQFFHLTESHGFIALACIIALWLLLAPLRGVLQGAADFRGYAASILIEGIVLVAAAIAFISLGWSVSGALWAWVLAAGLGVLYSLPAVRSHLSFEPTSLEIETQRLLKTIAGVGLTALATTLALSDVIVARRFLSPNDAGLYAAAALCGRVIYFAVSFVPVLLVPKVVAAVAQHRPTMRLLLYGAGIAAALAAWAVALLAVVPGAILRLLVGGSFAGASSYVLQYAIAMALLAGVAVATSYQTALHRFGYVMPVLAILSGEFIAILIFHDSAFQIIHTLIAGNALALAAALVAVRADA